MARDLHAGDIEYSVTPNFSIWTGLSLTVVVRRAIPDVPPGCWKWGAWRNATEGDLYAVMHAIGQIGRIP